MLDLLTSYPWPVALCYMLTVMVLMRLSNTLPFKVAAIEEMRQWNRREDAPKRKKPKYPPIMKQNGQVGSFISLLLILIVAPAVLTLESMAWWRFLTDIVCVLLVYDFIYYFTHRFLFHGELLKRVHGLHHQARDISYIDAHYVHPLETFIGLMIYVVSITAVSLSFGGLHVVAAAFAFVIWSQINTINHTKFNLDRFPYKTINYLTTKHAIHHQNMNMGNYSSITPLFDKLFGTLD